MSHYYSEKQKSPLKIKRIKSMLRGKELEFFTGSGVFSGKRIDKGTEVLIENCKVDNDDRILDYGCGYGAVGIAVAKAFPESEVIMTDINKRAIKLAKMNLESNSIDNAGVHHISKFQKQKKYFDVVLLNPPQTAGKQVCFNMIEESQKYLKDNGSLQLVARHNKGGKELSKKMQKVFGNVKEIAKKGGYRVYASKKGNKGSGRGNQERG